MSLDTYLPEGEGKYIVGNAAGGAGSFYYFIPKSPGHVKIGFLVMGTGEYINAEYTDVVIYNPDAEFDTLESGQYHIEKKSRYSRTVELSTNDRTRRYHVYAQPRLGRFRLLSDQ
ncbi:MAG TPA: hypothetical protein VMC61_01310 [Methanocella sp.]|nr:hypothetical protein [Methanocella sp.]